MDQSTRRVLWILFYAAAFMTIRFLGSFESMVFCAFIIVAAELQIIRQNQK